MIAFIDERLINPATVATTLNNINKYSTYRKNFFVLCGNAGNKVHFLYIGDRLNKKIHPLKPLTQCKKQVQKVINAPT